MLAGTMHLLSWIRQPMHEVVVMTRPNGRWPVGTIATIVDELEGAMLIEIVGLDGRTRALLEVTDEDVDVRDT